MTKANKASFWSFFFSNAIKKENKSNIWDASNVDWITEANKIKQTAPESTNLYNWSQNLLPMITVVLIGSILKYKILE